MIRIGNFFFKYRNWIFIFLYAAVLIPSWPLFSKEQFGNNYYIWPIGIGAFITCLGQLFRALTIGLAYIIRGGKYGKPYADNLITGGVFNHCRNPLYVGNILTLLGVGILANSLVYTFIVMPVFLFIYQAIVLAEENFLRNKFGPGYDEYCKDVNRWWPNLKGFGKTLRSMTFKWNNWIINEHTSQLFWLIGITLVLFFNYPEITGSDKNLRNQLLIIVLGIIFLAYGITRYLYKKGIFLEDPY